MGRGREEASVTAGLREEPGAFVGAGGKVGVEIRAVADAYVKGGAIEKGSLLVASELSKGEAYGS